MTIKTPEQIADEALARAEESATSPRRALIRAIEADRAQRGQYSVIAEKGRDGNEARVGAYGSRFEAEAVARAWYDVNGQYGIEYRVEEDW